MENQQFATDGTGSTTTEENHNSNYFERQPITDSPFEAIRTEEHPWHLIYGNYKLRGAWASIEEVIEYVESKPWQLIGEMVSITMYHQNKLNKGE